MAGKKGPIPGHVKKKDFSRPGKEEPFIKVLEELEGTQSYSFHGKYPIPCSSARALV